MIKASILIAAIVAIGAAGNVSLGFAAPPCLLDKTVPEGELAYKNRGTRCEGIYERKVAIGSRLAILGFHKHDPDIADNTSTLYVQVVNAPQDLLLQVASLRRNHYYQMDTRTLAPNGTFRWPTDLIRRFGLRGDEMGALACSGDCKVRGEQLPILYPVSISSKEQPHKQNAVAPIIVAKPAPQTSEMRLTLQEISGGSLIYDRVEFGWAPYDSEEPVSFYLTKPLSPGRYLLIVEARTRNGGTEQVRAFVEIP